MSTHRLLAAFVALIAALVAAFAPVEWFEFFRLQVVGSPEPLDSNIQQRVVAVLGGLAAGFAVFRLLSRPNEESLLPKPPARRLQLAAIPFAAVMAINVLIGVMHLTGTKVPAAAGRTAGEVRVAIEVGFLAALAAAGLAATIAVGPALLRERSRLASILPDAILAGAAYGFFSALWHCCAPLWSFGPIPGGVLTVVLIAASLLCLGFIAAVGTRFAFPKGEIAGALLLALIYPYHTPEWFLQCLGAGAFFTFLARRTGSLAAPGIALATAFLTHMSLPFLEWGGPALAAAILIAAVLGASRAAPSPSPGTS